MHAIAYDSIKCSRRPKPQGALTWKLAVGSELSIQSSRHNDVLQLLVNYINIVNVLDRK